MPSRHLSLRVDAEALDRLDAESRRTGRSRSNLAKTLLEEGLRMEAHPDIIFRSGPAGRRPVLNGGPDVWEVARVYRDLKGSGEDRVRRTARLTSLAPAQVHAVVRYYAEFQDEVDRWVQQVDDEAERAYAAWRKEQQLLNP